jgi:prephenate dehydrogenase
VTEPRVALLGVGLIGGSIGLAARRLGIPVVGYDPDADALRKAIELGAIDEAATDVASAVADADVVFVATPVGVATETAQRALATAGSDCAVSDVGSTKRQIAHAIDDRRFVGGHPLAGAETAGVENARADLFQGATWYLTPGHPAATPAQSTPTPAHDTPMGSDAAATRSTGGSVPAQSASPTTVAAPFSAQQRLYELIARLGARPVTIDADAHDRLMASVSHLQHVLANVLVAQVSRAVERLEGLEVEDGTLGAGPSFRDATRVAGANTAIWTDIYMSNRDALIAAIDDAVERLGEVRIALEKGDAAALAAWNERARAERQRLQRAGLTAAS